MYLCSSGERDSLNTLRIPLCQAAACPIGEDSLEPAEHDLEEGPRRVGRASAENEQLIRGLSVKSAPSRSGSRRLDGQQKGLQKAASIGIITETGDMEGDPCLGFCGPAETGTDQDDFDPERRIRRSNTVSGNSTASAARTIQTSWRKRYGVKTIDKKGRLRSYLQRVRKVEEYYSHKVEEYMEDKRLRAMNRLRRISTPILSTIFQSIRDLVKVQATADPHMPHRLRPVLHDISESVIDDLEVEVDLTLRNATMASTVKRHGTVMAEPPKWYLRRLLRFRAFILFHWLPYDKSIFGKLKDPWYLVLMLISAVPTPLVRPVFFSMVLSMLLYPWPPDEYQLIAYILSFKGTQFFTTGVVSLLSIAIDYFMCYLFAGDAVRECINREGPGASTAFFRLGLDLLATVLLVWIAFFTLPYSKRRYAFHVVKPSDHQELEGKFNRGGRLFRLLRYDIASFGVCTVLMLLLYAADIIVLASPEDLESHRKELIYWCRVLYGLSALPFSFFILPVVGRFLTHVDNTGYDEDGSCRLFDYAEAAQDRGTNEGDPGWALFTSSRSDE
mmetsp:Transcript_6509/g.11306  ORF Transcript_6509/g.11306 Transcript_6509/m.11306 type:complete len:559 (+) Transcript_6509:56-1732(+)